MKRILLTALCLAIIFTLCAPAGLADETKDDFLLIGGTWSTPYEEYRDKFSVEPVTENQDGIVTTSFQNVKLTSVDASADIDYFKIGNSDVTNIVNMYLEVNNAFLFNHKNAMETAFHTIVKEGDALYEGRSVVLFDSPETLEQVYTDRFSRLPYEAAFLNGITTIIETYFTMYETRDYGCISGAKAWMLDNHSGVFVIYSGNRINDNTIVVCSINLESSFNQMGTIFNIMGVAHADASCERFGLPDSLAWGDDLQTASAALPDADVMEYGDDTLLNVFFPSWELTGGYDTDAYFQFQNDKLYLASYYFPKTDCSIYEDIVSMITEDWGSAVSGQYREPFLQAVAVNLNFDKAEVWFSDSTFLICLHDPDYDVVYIMTGSIEIVLQSALY